jgi:hypothetical protein
MCKRDLQAAIKVKRQAAVTHTATQRRLRGLKGVPSVPWTNFIHREVMSILAGYFEPALTSKLPPVVMMHVFTFLHITNHRILCTVSSEWEVRRLMG